MASPAVPILFSGLIVWGMYRRIRRNIGRQPLRPVRHVFSIVILCVVVGVLCAGALPFPGLLLAIGGGIAAGALLGVIGLRLTKFETTEAGHFYTPDMRIGIALSLLFIGRLLYRFWILRNTAANTDQSQLFHSPLTFLIFGLMAGYYIVYHAGILWHNRDSR